MKQNHVADACTSLLFGVNVYFCNFVIFKFVSITLAVIIQKEILDSRFRIYLINMQLFRNQALQMYILFVQQGMDGQHMCNSK